MNDLQILHLEASYQWTTLEVQYVQYYMCLLSLGSHHREGLKERRV